MPPLYCRDLRGSCAGTPENEWTVSCDRFQGSIGSVETGCRGAGVFFFIIYCFSSLINFDDCSGGKFSSDYHKYILSLDDLYKAGMGQGCIVSFPLFCDIESFKSEIKAFKIKSK